MHNSIKLLRNDLSNFHILLRLHADSILTLNSRNYRIKIYEITILCNYNLVKLICLFIVTDLYTFHLKVNQVTFHLNGTLTSELIPSQVYLVEACHFEISR